MANQGGQGEVDIAVVGAGVAGAYSAWRLRSTYTDRKVTLFELSDRVGGRLYSKTLPGMPHVTAELGGMRYIPNKHHLVSGLIGHLRLASKQFPMGSAEPVGSSSNIMYLRGRLLRVRDLADWTQVPYGLRVHERGKNPDQLQEFVMRSLFPYAASFTQEDWYRARVFEDEPLYTLGFWNLLYRVLSSEAYQFMYDAGGYYTNVSDSNAASALPTEEFLPNVDYRTLTGGYQQLPLALVNTFTTDLGGRFLPNHRLDSIRRSSDGRYALRFVLTETRDAHTNDVSPETDVMVNACDVILAMPRRSLERIRWDPIRHDEWLRENVPSVVTQAAIKLFLAYPHPWWRALGLESGRSITDMPIRQTYYFGTECEEGGDPSNTNSLLMVSYNDLSAVAFWKALEESGEFEGQPNSHVGSSERQVPVHDFTVTKGMVLHAQQQVAEVHGLKFIPEPYSAIYQDWSEDPFGGGWHAWKAGFRFWEIMKRMRKPIDDERIYICGEAYSNVHGWVEGALKTAELVLEEHFSVSRPHDWLSADYALGP